MNTIDWLHKTLKRKASYPLKGRISDIQAVRPRAICKDGFSISIQAGSGLYCHPRQDWMYEYDMVELGYPSNPDDLIAEYAEDPDDLTGTVYAYVPVEVVDQLLEKHGGLVDDEDILQAN
jgi:hypothetical protein